VIINADSDEDESDKDDEDHDDDDEDHDDDRGGERGGDDGDGEDDDDDYDDNDDDDDDDDDDESTTQRNPRRNCSRIVEEREITEAGSRKRYHFSEEEDAAIRAGLEVYRDIDYKWMAILEDPSFGPVLAKRSSIDIKDRVRVNFKKRPRVPDREGRDLNDSGSRKRIRWTIDESEALLRGIERHRNNNNKWASILRDPDFRDQLVRRKSLDLKDRLRNMMKKSRELAVRYADIVQI
jgi:hypothetical protein